MKSIFLATAIVMLSLTGIAQSAKVNPAVKPGLTLEYEILAQGQAIPLTMKIASVSEAELIFEYDMSNGAVAGKFVNTKANLEKGVSLNWDQPVPGEERRLDETQTLGMVSRAFLQSIKTQKKGQYDGMDFALTAIPAGKEINIGGKVYDVIYAESANGGTKMWILNNDLYPVLLKIEGTSAGIDMTIKDIR
jgi:hypothetical protein